MSHWKTADESRIQGAASVLEEATKIAQNCYERGPCPLTEEEIASAKTLAGAAVVMLDGITNPNDWRASQPK